MYLLSNAKLHARTDSRGLNLHCERSANGCDEDVLVLESQGRAACENKVSKSINSMLSSQGAESRVRHHACSSLITAVRFEARLVWLLLVMRTLG